jgi:hypothetical protein
MFSLGSDREIPVFKSNSRKKASTIDPSSTICQIVPLRLLLKIYSSSLSLADGADWLQWYMWSLAYESMVQESIYRLLSCRGSSIRLMTRRKIVLDWWYRIRDRCGSEGNCWGNTRCGPLRGSSGWNVAVFSIVGAFSSILFGQRQNFCESHIQVPHTGVFVVTESLHGGLRVGLFCPFRFSLSFAWSA